MIIKWLKILWAHIKCIGKPKIYIMVNGKRKLVGCAWSFNDNYINAVFTQPIEPGTMLFHGDKK